MIWLSTGRPVLSGWQAQFARVDARLAEQMEAVAGEDPDDLCLTVKVEGPAQSLLGFGGRRN
ncbi:hypothetical protein E3T23_00390 [Cryobacterium cheniae]|uniref:Uncharacterized protein n=1 Tax=Cryobacterium cheniae TaxID=1259262 RepID=A0A4V3IIX4_9MICO|nr:hypothetical protein [Cryobacterium cheniae]TFC84195.1 hypothetical protein E3T23_00390 [Cryobacterium cheniae]